MAITAEDAVSSAAPRVPGMRASQCARIVELLVSGSRLVTVVGLGGIGKTSLALDVVDTLNRDHPEFDCAHLEIGPSDTMGISERILDEVSSAADGFALDETADDEVAHPRLLILDGGEHIVAVAHELERVLDLVPDLQLLVTSRVALGTPSEATIPLRGLSTAADGAAAALFLSLAREGASEPAAEDMPRVLEIVSRLGGYPLAIHLAAAQLQTQTLASLHEQIVTRRTADALPGTDPVLRTVIAWSLERQSQHAVRLLALLSVFSGWCTLDSIEGVAAEFDRRSSGGGRRVVGRTLWLAELVEAGLVEAKQAPLLGDDALLYRVHDSVSEVARLHSADSGVDGRVLTSVHRDWFGRKAEELTAAVTTRRESAAFEQLQAELSEYLLALDAMIDSDASAALDIVAGLGEFWLTRGRIRSGARLMRRALLTLGAPDALEAGRLDAPITVTLAQSWLAHMSLRQGVPVSTLDHERLLAEHLEAFFAGMGDAGREHFALAVHHIFVAMVNKHYAAASRTGELCHRLAVGAGDDYHAGLFAFYLARVAEQAGDAVAASEHIARAIVHVRRTRNESFLAKCVSQSVLLERERLSPTELIDKLRPLPEIHMRNRSFKDAALISIPLALALFEAGRREEGLTTLRSTLALSHRIRYFDGELYAVILIAFSELSEHSMPENVMRCARLYGSVRPYMQRFEALIAPDYQQQLRGGIYGLGLMLGQQTLDRITEQSPSSWPQVVDEADAFAAEQLANMQLSHATSEPDAADRFTRGKAELNEREQELLALVLTGITDKQVAERLGLKPNTVRSYNSRIFRKFDVASRTELLALHRGATEGSGSRQSAS